MNKIKIWLDKIINNVEYLEEDEFNSLILSEYGKVFDIEDDHIILEKMQYADKALFENGIMIIFTKLTVDFNHCYTFIIDKETFYRSFN